MSQIIPGRVLVVDDEFQLMEVLVEALNSQGYAAQGFQTGIAAIEALQKQEFDLLLTDLMMPDMDGIALLRACTAIDPNLVGIVMTGQGTVPTAVEAMKTGAFDYVLKPFRLEMLLPVLKRAMEVRQLRLENIQLRETVAIYNLSQTIAFSLDSRLVLENTAEAALQQLEADEVSIMLLTPDKQELHIAAIRGRGREHLLGQHRSLQEGIAGWVARHVEPLILNGEVSDPRFAPVQPRSGIPTAICMPMVTAGKLVGILNVNRLQARHPFAPGQVKALSILTGTAAAALENESLYRALEASEKRFRSLIEHAPDGIALLGLDGKLRQVTPSTQRILGYTLEEAVGQDPASLTHPDDLPALLELLTDLIQNPGRVVSTEYRFRHKDGSWRWLESTISNLIAEPSVEAIVFNYRDITERKQAEQEIESLANFPQENNSPVLRLARDGRLLYANPASANLLKLWDCEVGNKPPDEIQLIAYQSLVMPMSQEIEVAHEHKIDALMFAPVLDKDYVNVYGRDITQRKQAEQAVLESERRMRALVTSLDDIVFEFDNRGRYLNVWTADESLLARPRAQLLGRTIVEILGEENGRPFTDAVQRVLANGDPESIEYPLELQGAQHWFLARISPIHTSDDSPKTVSMLIRDITERKRAEEALRESEIRFRSLIENSSDEISIINANGELMYESPTANPTLGYQPGEFLGQDLFQLIHPDDLARVQEQLARLMQDPNSHPRDQFRLRHQNGGWRWVEAVGTNLLSEPSVRGIVINYHDITERKRAEEKIERQLQRLNALRAIDMAISSSFDIRVTLDIVLQHVISQVRVDAAAVLLINPDGQTIEYAASRGFRSTAIRQSRFRVGEGYAGKVILERRMIHIPDLTQTGGKFARALLLKGEDFMDYYCVPLIVKGEVKGVLETFHRSRLNPGPESLDFLETLAGQAAIALDNAQLFENLQRANTELEGRVAERTAELHRTNAELEHANRAKDEFLANMSHELRTPLNSILGLTESLIGQQRGPINESQQKFLQFIESSGRHLLDLINDILDLSKIEAGMLEHHPQLIPVDEICQASLSFVRSQAIKKSLTLSYTNEAAVPVISADLRQLKQILVNLLTNAVKFTPEKGEVTLQVRTDPDKELIQFSIIDTGIGIAPEDLKRLFTPFVQVDSGLNRLNEGTGLGLALVQKLTDLHGGSVEVESEVGKGSRFSVNLHYQPALPEGLEAGHPHDLLRVDEQAESADLGSTALITHRKVLLAEDNAANILTIGDYLDSHGFEILVAHDGLDAIEKAEQSNPDIILMDIQMPTMDGLEATRRLRANPRFAATPIIALTALAMPGDRERCLEAGATEYLSKPVGLRTLVAAIDKLLGNAG